MRPCCPLSCSIAAAGVKDAEILNAIIDAILKKDVGTFYPQALSNVTWACATLEHLNTRYLDVGTPSLHSGRCLSDRKDDHKSCLMSALAPTNRALDFQQPPNRQMLACPRPGRRQNAVERPTAPFGPQDDAAEFLFHGRSLRLLSSSSCTGNSGRRHKSGLRVQRAVDDKHSLGVRLPRLL